IAIAGLGFSWLVAEGLFKLPGMSRSGETLEVRVRTSVFPREAETRIRAGPCALAPAHLLRSQLGSTRRSGPAYGLSAEHHQPQVVTAGVKRKPPAGATGSCVRGGGGRAGGKRRGPRVRRGLSSARGKGPEMTDMDIQKLIVLFTGWGVRLL